MIVKENIFSKIYPFATENVNAYFKGLDLFGKEVLTVGSSLDQLFNAISYLLCYIFLFCSLNRLVRRFHLVRQL